MQKIIDYSQKDLTGAILCKALYSMLSEASLQLSAFGSFFTNVCFQKPLCLCMASEASLAMCAFRSLFVTVCLQKPLCHCVSVEASLALYAFRSLFGKVCL